MLVLVSVARKSGSSVRDRSAADAAILRDVCQQLAVVRVDEPVPTTGLLELVARWLEVDTLLLYSARDRTGRWQIERWEGVGRAVDAEPLARRMFDRAPEFPLFYNPNTPHPAQRNRLVDARAWVEKHAPGTWERSPICIETLAPLNLHRWHQPRALLCDGPSLLAWFGALTERSLDRRQTRMLAALIEPMRQRLVAERRLFDSPGMRAPFEVLLDRLGRPAFLLDARGRILHASESGRSVLDHDRAAVTSSLAAAMAGRPTTLPIELIAVDGRGLQSATIAIVGIEAECGSARIAACVAHCAMRWSLTPRQREVLELVTRGMANATIAATLQCVERTVELHVTTLLDRAGVDNRAALVSQVLTSR